MSPPPLRSISSTVCWTQSRRDTGAHPPPPSQELYDLRSEYGQKKRALNFCNCTFTTLGEKKFCILHLLEDVKYSTQ